MTTILGLRSKHDASAALVIDGQLAAAAEEERFSKRKHHFGFPTHSINAILAEAGLRPQDVDVIARDGISMRKTLVRFARQQMVARTPRLAKELVEKSMNRWVYRRTDVKSNEEASLAGMGFKPNYFLVEHHPAHALYSYYASGIQDATVMALDGRGHYLAGVIYRARGGKMELLSEIIAEGGSLGLFYSAVTDALGFQVGDGDGKTMGLACYGDPQVALKDLEPYAPVVRGLTTVRNKEWDLSTDVVRNRLYAHYGESAALRLMIDKYGDANLAAAAQYLLEQRMEELVRNAVAATGIKTLVAGGGVFLNVKASKHLIDSGVVDSIFVPPGPGDDGLSAGYAYAAALHFDGHAKIKPMSSAYLGPSESDEEILREIMKYGDVAYEKLASVPETTAKLIAEGNVIGWFEGKMEWGPRALGSRSVLADPRDPHMRDHINDKLKKRDWFMPFAPSVLSDYCDEVFVNYQPSPYMNLAFDMKPPYDTCVPAIMHIDKTARPQEVRRDTNAIYYDTINAFRQLTGIPLVLNTSFNRHGLPIVASAKDAVNHLRWGCVDLLIIGNYLVRRTGPAVAFPGVDKVALDEY